MPMYPFWVQLTFTLEFETSGTGGDSAVSAVENLSAHPELHLIDGGVEGGAEGWG